MDSIYKEISNLIESDGIAALAIVVETSGSAPQKVGAKMLVAESGKIYGTVGGGKVELETIKYAKKVAVTGKPIIKEFDLKVRKGSLGVACGGSMKIYIEPVRGVEKIIIFGAGHIGYYLSKMADMLGFKIIVVDARGEFANKSRFPQAARIYTSKNNFFKEVKINSGTFIVIATHSHKLDKEILKDCLKYNSGYTGMIGSQAKKKTVFKELQKEGISSNKLRRVSSPIGLDIKAQTPQEIAVSIMAEIVKVKNRRIK